MPDAPPDRSDPAPVDPDALRPDPARGVFETMRVADGRVQALDAHIARLASSLRGLYGSGVAPAMRSDITGRAAGLVGEHRLRVDVGPGGGFAIETSAVDGGGRGPVALTPIVVPGGLGAHKWRDRRLIDGHGPDPVPLLVDADGDVLEAAWGNVWVANHDRLITPPADGRILPGVTRALLLERAPRLGLVAAEQPIQLRALRAAGTVFVTSSLRLAVPAAVGAPPTDPSALVDRIRLALAVF
jgi:para-aminobenzoate synthetase / 4-amino-4-deoxychorismate lyase